MATTFGGPASRPDQTLAWNMTLIGHHELSGFGGIGEGMAVIDGMRPLIEVYPRVERCAWESPVYYELLRRGLRWAKGEL